MNEINFIEEEITLQEFAERFVGVNDFETPNVYNIEHLGIEILGRDLKTNEDVYKPLQAFVVKDSVENYYTNGILKGTSVHRVIEDGIEIPLKDHPGYKIVEEKMHVVDVSVKDIENYYANGILSHNTTPGGKALKFAASVRVQLAGKTPVKIMDPNIEREYKAQITQWEEECRIWKENGSSKGTGMPKPSKPTKPKGDEIIIGYDVIAKTVKNKVGPPKREAEFRIIFLQGVVEEPAWLDYAIKFGLVELVNSYTFKLSDPKFISTPQFEREQWLDILSDIDVYEYIKEKVKTGLIREAGSVIASGPIESDDDDDDDEISEIN